MKQIPLQKTLFIAGIILAITIAVLFFMGRTPWCTCGYIKLWHGIVYSSQNSQHIFDWYSLSHVLHGLLFYLIIWLGDRKNKLSFRTKLLIAIALECGWEIIENSPFIIDRYRAATISLDYYGDSIVNSLGDIFAMTAGFIFAGRNKIVLSLVLFIFIELFLLYNIRDNLTLNIIMLIHPIDSIKHWQSLGAALPH